MTYGYVKKRFNPLKKTQQQQKSAAFGLSQYLLQLFWAIVKILLHFNCLCGLLKFRLVFTHV